MVSDILINEIINVLTEKYDSQINNLYIDFFNVTMSYNKDDMYRCMEKQRKLVTIIINEVITYFPQLNKCYFIVLNGSYARHSNILFSDLDFNIFYKNKEKIFPIELTINYIISKILKYRGCDRIHSIMVYTNLISNYHPKINDYNKIEFKNIKIPYFCRENYEDLLYKTFNTSREFNDLLNYFDSQIENDNIFYEWQNNFEIIKDYGKYEDFISKIKLQNINISKNNKLGYLAKKEISKILLEIKDYSYIEKNDYMYIKDIKNIIKSIPMNILYSTLSVLSRINNLDKVKLESFYDSKIINKKFNDSIYYYLWNITRIEIILDLLGYDLSSHSSKSINMIIFNNKYRKIYNNDFFEINNNAIKNLYKNISYKLQSERKNQYE